MHGLLLQEQLLTFNFKCIERFIKPRVINFVVEDFESVNHLKGYNVYSYHNIFNSTSRLQDGINLVPPGTECLWSSLCTLTFSQLLPSRQTFLERLKTVTLVETKILEFHNFFGIGLKPRPLWFQIVINQFDRTMSSHSKELFKFLTKCF